MYQLSLSSIPLPKVYVSESKSDTDILKKSGIPFIIKPKGWDDRKLVAAIFINELKKRFPYVKWDEQFGIRTVVSVWVPSEQEPGTVEDVSDRAARDGHHPEDGEDECVYDAAEGPREFAGEALEHEIVTAGEFFEDIANGVDIEKLQELKLLPKWLDDIATSIKASSYSSAWQDGWNKKLDCNIGRYIGGYEAPNLVILDVSGSIPYGITATMTTLIDSIRTQLDADLIVTGGRTFLYPKEEPLPDPEYMAKRCGLMNERDMFVRILEDHVFHRHWGNVVVFGDSDCPGSIKVPADTFVDNLMCYHTGKGLWRSGHMATPGYGRWAYDIAKQKSWDKTWAEGIKAGYR